MLTRLRGLRRSTFKGVRTMAEKVCITLVAHIHAVKINGWDEAKFEQHFTRQLERSVGLSVKHLLVVDPTAQLGRLISQLQDGTPLPEGLRQILLDDDTCKANGNRGGFSS